MSRARFVIKIYLLLALALASSAVFAEARLWTLLDGQSFEGTYIVTVGTDYVLKSPKGKQIKVPANTFSEKDRIFVELSNPPKLKIDFIKDLKQITFAKGWYGEFPREPEQHGNFGFRVKQTSSGAYGHDLRAEFYAVGKQLNRSDAKCFLLDRGEVFFQLTEESKRTFEFRSDRQVRLQNWALGHGVGIGEVYYAYVIVITDERGAIVAIEASRSWLETNIENLRKLKVGNYFDDDCIRCFPARSKSIWW